MGYMFLPLARYFDFSGRSRRMEYWMFMLLQAVVVSVLFGFIIAAVIEATDADGVMRAEGEEWLMSTGGGLIPILLLGLFWLLFIIPTIAVQVRRFHDLDKSGAWVLVNLIPLGSFVVMIMMFMDGTPGPNRYGPDPKNRQPLHYGYGAQGGYPPPQGGYPGQQGYGAQAGFGAQPGQAHPGQPYPGQPGGYDPGGRPLG